MADRRAKRIAELIEPLRVKPGSKVNLAKDFDPGYTAGYVKKKDGAPLLQTGIDMLCEYQARLAAQDSYGVLVCLQALDAGGKDGTISHVMSGVNPQGVQVNSYKVPSSEELDHDYLWRYARRLPARGDIGIFNRSHYEEVLVVRVHPENLDRQRLPKEARGKDVWDRRYREINDWERYLTDNGFKVVKLFLNLSREEQRIRFLKRIDLPEKNWKFSSADARERQRWDDYQRAFSQMLSATSTKWAPWYVIPADHKWFARLCAAGVLVHTLIQIDPQYPAVSADKREELLTIKDELEDQAPKGAPADPFAAKEAKKEARARLQQEAKPEVTRATGNGQQPGRADSRDGAGAGRLPDGPHPEQDGRPGPDGYAGQPDPEQDGRPEPGRAAEPWRGHTPGQAPARPAELRIGRLVVAVQAGAAGQSATTDRNWYARSPDEVTAALGVDPAVGLSASRAAELLSANGPNALPEEEPKPGWRRFLDQYRSYMQIILIAAAIVSLAIKEWSTAVLLLALTVLNAVIGLRQEGKAESAMNALKSMMKATARVRRDGSEAQIPAEQVVVGDVVLIAAGDEVPADGRIIAASALQIDESALTGESVPAAKDAETLSGDELGPGDQTDMAFMNTPVTHGSGIMIVTGTGAGTELGKISGMLAATATEESPLTRELNRLTLYIAAAAGLTMIVMFALGRARGQAWDHLFTAAVSLAIAAIPEALPTVSQTILSLGSVNLAKRNAIVKDLPSVETLGFTSAINSDKTGTLTMNQMTAVEVISPGNRYTISGIGYGLDGEILHPAGATARIEDAILPYLVASDAKLVEGKVVGDPTEGALLVLGYKAGMDIDATREELSRLATLPFDPTYKLMATFNSATDAAGRPVVRCFVKGAAPAVMHRAATALSDGTRIPWDSGLNERAQEHMERMEGEGQRVMAAATRDLDPAEFDPDGDLLSYVTDLQMTSLVGMVDPARDESRDAVASAQAAHIRVRMVTGDDVTTGAAIAKQVGIGGEAILGADFAALSEAERLARIDDIGVLGRVAPEHKVLLADTLKQKGDVVAMTGDGVNDAPAIKAADIGIAMGTGTEVAKNAGRMILSDDNFATIVFAVEQGRKIYDNLTKYIRFVLVLLVVFVLTFLGATLFNIAAGEPFTPAQVLWIHFFVNAPFGFALGFDKESPGLMARTPRPRGAPVLTTGVMITVGLAGLAITIGLLSLIELGQHHFGSVQAGQSIAFTSFALCLIVAALECRSETDTVLTTASFDSKQMNWAMLGEFVLAVLVTQMDAFRRLLGTTQINLREFGWALVPAIALLVLWELGKLLARRSASRVTPTADSEPLSSAPSRSPHPGGDGG